MTLKGNCPIRSKIVLENKSLEQNSNFKCLGSNISFKANIDFKDNLNV